MKLNVTLEECKRFFEEEKTFGKMSFHNRQSVYYDTETDFETFLNDFDLHYVDVNNLGNSIRLFIIDNDMKYKIDPITVEEKLTYSTYKITNPYMEDDIRELRKKTLLGDAIQLMKDYVYDDMIVRIYVDDKIFLESHDVFKYETKEEAISTYIKEFSYDGVPVLTEYDDYHPDMLSITIDGKIYYIE